MATKNLIGNEGTICLPLVVQVFESIIKREKDLLQNYSIDFVASDDNLLASVSNSVKDDPICDSLGKDFKAQEEFCAMTEVAIRESNTEYKDEMLSIFERTKDRHDMRFIRLRKCEDGICGGWCNLQDEPVSNGGRKRPGKGTPYRRRKKGLAKRWLTKEPTIMGIVPTIVAIATLRMRARMKHIL